MRREIVLATSGFALIFCNFTSCDTPVGQGAAWGAATGAIIGGAATGHVRAASIGAAAGAAAGAFNRRNHSGKSSCALWPAAAGWLSIRALGRDAGFLLQSLHRTRL